MRPALFEVWGFSLPAYGTTMVTLFVGGLLLLRQRLRPLGIPDARMLDLATIAGASFLVWTAIGILLRWLGVSTSVYFNALPILAIGAFAYLAYLRKSGLPAEEIFDAVAPIAAFALAVQYGVGTLLAGTAFGKPTTLPWGIAFPPGSPAFRVYGTSPLHPVQLYLGVSFLLIAACAFFSSAKLLAGQRALFTFIAIAVAYLSISPFRGNTTSFLAGEAPRMSEFVAVFILLYCSFMAWRRSHLARPN